MNFDFTETLLLGYFSSTIPLGSFPQFLLTEVFE